MQIAPLSSMANLARAIASVVLIGTLIGWSATQAEAQDPQGDAVAAREQKAQETTPPHRSAIERLLYKLEDDLLLQRWLAPPRGVYLRVGKIGEGAGFALGPAIRYNTATFDFQTSAAASIKQYFLGEASLRFPGTIGQDSYFKPHGPYIELYGRHRDFPQEDFFGSGPDSELSRRSDFALRDDFGRLSAGYQRGTLKAGVGVGYLDVSIGAGTDVAMPSSTVIFPAREMPGVLDHHHVLLVLEPFVEFATIDRAKNDQAGVHYRVSVAEYRDRDRDRYAFMRWEADLQHYITFTKDIRTIALRAWASSATPDTGFEVPFYLLPTLGGARTLRGYQTFRFRDRSAALLQAEYRWRINEFVTGALFYDTGAVAATLDEIGRLERNYGFGLRAGGREGSAFRLDFAFGGREGHRLLLRFDDVF